MRHDLTLEVMVLSLQRHITLFWERVLTAFPMRVVTWIGIVFDGADEGNESDKGGE